MARTTDNLQHLQLKGDDITDEIRGNIERIMEGRHLTNAKAAVKHMLTNYTELEIQRNDYLERCQLLQKRIQDFIDKDKTVKARIEERDVALFYLESVVQ